MSDVNNTKNYILLMIIMTSLILIALGFFSSSKPQGKGRSYRPINCLLGIFVLAEPSIFKYTRERPTTVNIKCFQQHCIKTYIHVLQEVLQTGDVPLTIEDDCCLVLKEALVEVSREVSREVLR